MGRSDKINITISQKHFNFVPENDKIFLVSLIKIITTKFENVIINMSRKWH